jgi:peptide-methionine (R)-S-oxide reductase
MSDAIKSDDEWRRLLTPQEYEVLRGKGTERAFTGKYDGFKEPGIYACAACGQDLFDADAKYDSKSGWPSFFKPIDESSVVNETDTAYGMIRTEVMCSACESHLGHVFDDGPQPTGQRYCMNSVSLRHRPRD